VLTPNGRLARHLRWRAGIEHQRAGATAWPTPDILALSQWLERCWEQSLVTGGEAGRRLLLSDAQFRHVSRDIIRDIAGEHMPGAGIERLIRKARVISAQWRISSRDLRASVTGPDTEFFADWTEHFNALCSKRGWVDAAGLPELLLPELDTLLAKDENRIVLAGFDHPTAAEARLFEQLDQSGRIAGRLVTSTPSESRSYQLKFDEPADERRAAASWAKTQLAAQPDALIGIVVPNLSISSGSYRRDFLDTFDPLWRERDDVLHPVSIIDGRRLSDTGIVRTAMLLMRVPSGRLDFTELGWLLRSPFVGDWEHEIDARARFDLRIRNDGLQTVSLRTLQKRFCSPEEPGPRKFLACIDALIELAETTRGAQEPAEWAGVIVELLTAAGFCHGRALSQRDDRTLKQWERLLEGFASMDEVTGRIGYRRALTLLDDAAREQPLDESGRDDGVHLVAPADVRGMDFDAVWISGMTSAAWPGDSRPSPLIPMSLQRDRGIPDALPDVYRARSLEQLRLLLAGSRQCIASWSAQEGEETLLPSPHITHLTPMQPVQLGFDSDLNFRKHQHCALDDAAHDTPPPVGTQEKIRGGSRLLTLQSVCPARAFFELRLGAKELPIPPFALNALTRGSLVHDAAEILYRELREGPATASDETVDAAIEVAIGRALDRHIPPMHPLAGTLRLTEAPRLERLLLNLIEFDRARGAVTVKDVENKQKIRVDDVELTVRFDRIDADDTDGRLVVDYKTGGKISASKWLGARPLEMQMPLYAACGNFDGIVLYWMHASGLSITGMGNRDWGFGRNRSFKCLSPEDWRERVGTWRSICEQMIAEYRGGDCRIDVENDGPATGDYAMLTRRWVLNADTELDPS